MFNLHRFIHKYPFETLHEMNLDWLIESVKELAKELEQYEIVNSISYGGEWDITKQYKAWTVVAVNGTTGYISLQPVPAGIDYTNSDYWVLIADFTVQLAGLAQRVTDLEAEVPLIHQEISNNTWLDGKKIVWYGDSWGTTTDNVVSKFIAKYPNVDVTNRCIGGTTITRLDEGEFPGYGSNSGYQRIRQDSIADFDYIFIMYGVNDWQTSRPLRNTDDDEYCYCYAVRETLNYILTNNPTVKPVMIFPTYCYRSFSTGRTDCVNVQGINLPAYINNAIDICEDLGVEYINLFENTPINETNYTSFMRNDSGIYVHPLAPLSQIIADAIFEGKKNTGRCYGDAWGGNIFTSIIHTTYDKTPEVSDTIPASSVSAYGPCMKVSSTDNHSFVKVTNKSDGLVMHIRAYNPSTDAVSFYVDRLNEGSSNVRTALFNVTKAGYIDCYVTIPRADNVAPAIITSGNDFIMTDIDIRIMSGSDYYQSNLTASAPSGITITSGTPYNIASDGIYTCFAVSVTPSSNISSGDVLIQNTVPTYSGANLVYFFGYNTTTYKPVLLYHVYNQIRTSEAVTAGQTIIIPEHQFKMPI